MNIHKNIIIKITGNAINFLHDLKHLNRFYSGGAFLLPEVLPEMEETTTRGGGGGGGGGYRGGGGGGCKCLCSSFVPCRL
jgi:hypothetical protein